MGRFNCVFRLVSALFWTSIIALPRPSNFVEWVYRDILIKADEGFYFQDVKVPGNFSQGLQTFGARGALAISCNVQSVPKKWAVFARSDLKTRAHRSILIENVNLLAVNDKKKVVMKKEQFFVQ